MRQVSFSQQPKHRPRFSLAAMLLTFIPFALLGFWIRPYFSPPPKWAEFSIESLKARQRAGKPLIVYYRDGWTWEFDAIESELRSSSNNYWLRWHGVDTMIARSTLMGDKPSAETELIRVTGTNYLPALVLYPSDPKRPPTFVKGAVTSEVMYKLLSESN